MNRYQDRRFLGKNSCKLRARNFVDVETLLSPMNLQELVVSNPVVVVVNMSGSLSPILTTELQTLEVVCESLGSER